MGEGEWDPMILAIIKIDALHTKLKLQNIMEIE
jgi:hypothetical protein